MFEINNVQKKLYVKKILDLIYLFILGLYIVRGLFDKSMFYLPWTTRYYEVLRIFMGFYLVVKICIYDIKCIKVLIFDILYLCIFYYIYKGTGYIFLLELGFFVLAAKDISYQKIMKFYAIVTSAIMAIIILGALTGCIEDLIYYKNDMYKHAFGIVYTTDFGAHILFLLLTCLSFRKKAPNIFINIAMLILAYLLYRFSGTRNSSGCIVILVLGGLYIKYSERETLKANKIGRFLRRIEINAIYFFDLCLIISVPISALIALLLTIYYSPDNAIMNKINIFSSGRLQLGKNAIEKYGLSIWGSPFDMIGIGTNLITRTDYNFVDSSYVMIFVRYGVILLLLAIGGFLGLSVKAKKAGNRYMILLLAIMAIQSIMEYHLLEIACNPFVLLIFANMESTKINSVKEKLNVNILRYSVAIVSALIIFTYHTKFLSYAKTIVTLLKLNEPERNIFFVLAFTISGIVLVITYAMLRKLYHSIIEGKKEKKVLIYGVVSALCIILISSGLFVCENVINRNATKYSQTIHEGKLILKQLNHIEDYKLYIDDIPYLYMKDKENKMNIIPGTPFRSDTKKAVVITKASNELINLLNSGYLCGQISDTEYLYTNDETIANIIRQSGVRMENYYSAKQSVDLLKVSQWNGLPTDENGGLIIDGSSNSIKYGPWITMYSGVYKIDYDLELLGTSTGEEEEAAKLKITSYYGANAIEEFAVKKSNFDGNGLCTISREVYIPDSVGVEFMLFPTENTQLKLKAITYEKIRKN